ncbi:hypothetical protein P7H06_20530 [Paenibacillus larvae]|nr:hypothetical protein [Paenibacillus larvae]MDT2261406.1 hypothetical protein [Paenibacillus larvae]
MNQKAKPNRGYGQKKLKSKMPDRKAGEKVPIGFLIEGNEEYYPRPNDKKGLRGKRKE